MNFNVIERTDSDINRETEELFNQVKPYLDKGMSLWKATATVKQSDVNVTHSWYQRLKKYSKEKGYE